MAQDDFTQLRAILDDFSRRDYSRSLIQRSLSSSSRSIPAIDQQEANRIWSEIDKAIVLYERCYIQCPTAPELIRAGNEIPRVVFNLGIERNRNLYDELEEAGERAIEEIGRQDRTQGVSPLYPKSDAYMRGYNA